MVNHQKKDSINTMINNKNIKINNKTITINYNENINSKVPLVILNTYEEDNNLIWEYTKNNNYILVTISNIDWNRELSPWYQDKLFKNDKEYLGDADSYINELINIIIPKIKEIINNELNIEIEEYILGGYSLAGLFSLYTIYKTNIFSKIICVSSSLWYPNLLKFIKENNYYKKPNKIYFSLGNKEKNTKNELMKKVEDNTIEIEKYYKDLGIKTIFEYNEGNHFNNPELRISKGINWILK